MNQSESLSQSKSASQSKSITKETIIRELTGVTCRDPLYTDPNALSVGWQTAGEYLCGNVRQKLRETRQAALLDDSYIVNVKALEDVQLKDLAP